MWRSPRPLAVGTQLGFIASFLGRRLDATTMALRNRGEPAGFARVAAPVMARAIRRATRADLRRLKVILERST